MKDYQEGFYLSDYARFFTEKAVALMRCPSDARPYSLSGKFDNELFQVVLGTSEQVYGLTAYESIFSLDHYGTSGILFTGSKTTLSEISDGARNTLLLGERPYFKFPDDRVVGAMIAWYPDTSIGIKDTTIPGIPFSNGHMTPSEGAYACREKAPWMYQPGDLRDFCHVYHFWSFHPGGANWLFGDGSVRFMDYDASPITPDLSTMSGGEVLNPDKY